MTVCPCAHGEPFEHCCGPILRGDKPAASALALMRSRYSAFATGDTDYLLASWHPSTRPEQLRIDPGYTWVGLDILGSTGGGIFDSEGTVEFRAHYVHNGRPDELHQNSSFVRLDGRWFFLS